MSSRRFYLLAFLILAATFGIRAAAASWWQARLTAGGQRFAMGDSDSYWQLGLQIAQGLPYHHHSPDAAVFRTPGYPYLLSWFVTEDAPQAILRARLFGAACGTLAVALLMSFVSYFSNRLAGLFAGLLAACYPGGIVMSILVLSEAPFQVFMVLTVGLLAWRYRLLTFESADRDPANTNEGTVQRADRKLKLQSYLLAGLAGVAAGVGVLIRPSWLLFPPFYFGLTLLAGPQRGHQFLAALCMGTVMSLTLAPWWIRNYQVTGHFVMTTLQVGPSLYDGLHEGATGASDTGMEFSAQAAARLRGEDTAAIAEATARGLPRPQLDSLEVRVNEELAGQAVQWARNNPWEVIRLAAVKFYRTWWPWPAGNQLPGGGLARHLIAWGMLLVVVPAFLALMKSRTYLNSTTDRPARHFWQSVWFPFVVPAIYFALLHSVFVGSARYRQPALFALIAIAAPCYAVWWQGCRQALFRSPSQDMDVRHDTA